MQGWLLLRIARTMRPRATRALSSTELGLIVDQGIENNRVEEAQAEQLARGIEEALDWVCC